MGALDYRGFFIHPVTFTVQPYYIDGSFVKFGYNVCTADGFINVMPGATWFRSIEDARKGVDVLLEVGGWHALRGKQDPPGFATKFWNRMHEVFPRST